MLVRAHNKGRFLQIALFIIGTLRFEGKSVPKLEKGGIEDLLSPGSKFAVLKRRPKSELANTPTKSEHSFS
jgi:hypothetical protein